MTRWVAAAERSGSRRTGRDCHDRPARAPASTVTSTAGIPAELRSSARPWPVAREKQGPGTVAVVVDESCAWDPTWEESSRRLGGGSRKDLLSLGDGDVNGYGYEWPGDEEHSAGSSPLLLCPSAPLLPPCSWWRCMTGGALCTWRLSSTSTTTNGVPGCSQLPGVWVRVGTGRAVE